MNFYRRRPLALALSLGIAMSAASAFLPRSAKILLMVLIIVCAFLSVLLLRGRLSTTIAGMDAPSFMLVAGAISLCMLLTSFACYDILAERYERLAADGKPCAIEAAVLDVRYESGFRAVYTLRLLSLDGEAAGSKGLLISDASMELSVGDTLECTAKFMPLGEAYSFYDMNEYDMMASGNYFACESDGNFIITGVKSGIEIFFTKLRGRLCAAISLYLGADASALSRALLLDDRSDLGITFINRDFARIGASHILSLSGLHLTVLCGMLEFVTIKLGAPKRLRSVLSIAFVIFYMLLTGLPFTVVRAGIMVIILQSGRMLGFDRDPITTLFMAGALILLADPPAFFDIGLEMSFTATLGVLVLSDGAGELLRPKFRRLIRKFKPFRHLRSLLMALFVTFGAIMFLVPLQWLHFGEISLITPISTLLLTPLCELLLWLLPFYMICSAAGLSFVAGRMGWLVTLLSEAAVRLASRLAELNTLVSLKYSFTVPIIIIFTVVIIIMIFKNVRSWLWSLLPFGISAAVFLCGVGIYEYLRSDAMIVCCIFDKSNEAFTLVSKGRGMIADISDGSVNLMRTASKTISDDYITEIDTCMLTHLHRRHAVSLRKLCEVRLVRRFLLPEPLTESEKNNAADICELAAEAGSEVVYYPRPDAAGIRFGNITLGVFGTSYITRSTHPLIGVKFGLGSTSAVYIGSTLWEDSRADGFVSDADIVIYGSHGPKIKTEPEFVFSGFPAVYSTAAGIDAVQLEKGLRIYVKP